MKKKKLETEKIVDSVGIAIHMKDGRSKEIPLEPWQLEVFTLILGLRVNLSDLDDYRMSSRENYEERMALYKAAGRDLSRRLRAQEAEAEETIDLGGVSL